MTVVAIEPNCCGTAGINPKIESVSEALLPNSFGLTDPCGAVVHDDTELSIVCREVLRSCERLFKELKGIAISEDEWSELGVEDKTSIGSSCEYSCDERLYIELSSSL